MHKWYKGNIHTHTNESDGDSDPEVVVDYFVEHNYDFLVLSDHNHLTILDYGKDKPDLLLIPGEEVTIREPFNIHVGAVGIESYVEPVYGKDSLDTLNANIKAIQTANGIPILNHPNYKWAVDDKMIIKSENLKFFEVFNGGTHANDLGDMRDGNKKNTDQIWDSVLSSGKLIYGVATDDSHHYKVFHSTFSNPGRGWVMVKSNSDSQNDILENFEMGNFYSSTGVYISDIFINKNEIRIDIDLNPTQIHILSPKITDQQFKTEFIGHNGEILSVSDDITPSYKIKGDEKYIRAVITSSDGYKAWIQPCFLSD